MRKDLRCRFILQKSTKNDGWIAATNINCLLSLNTACSILAPDAVLEEASKSPTVMRLAYSADPSAPSRTGNLMVHQTDGCR